MSMVFVPDLMFLPIYRLKLTFSAKNKITKWPHSWLRSEIYSFCRYLIQYDHIANLHSWGSRWIFDIKLRWNGFLVHWKHNLRSLFINTRSHKRPTSPVRCVIDAAFYIWFCRQHITKRNNNTNAFQSPTFRLPIESNLHVDLEMILILTLTSFMTLTLLKPS